MTSSTPRKKKGSDMEKMLRDYCFRILNEGEHGDHGDSGGGGGAGHGAGARKKGNPENSTSTTTSEVEVQFFHEISRSQYHDVAAKLYRVGFVPENANGNPMLRIFLTTATRSVLASQDAKKQRGRQQHDDRQQQQQQKQHHGGRWEIQGLDLIEEYARTNQISDVFRKIEKQNEHLETSSSSSSSEHVTSEHHRDSSSLETEKEKYMNRLRVKYTEKRTPQVSAVPLSASSSSSIVTSSSSSSSSSVEKDVVTLVVVDDFQYKIAYKVEHTVSGRSFDEMQSDPLFHDKIREWDKYGKKFRYLNRVRFVHPLYPLFVDVTIVKSSLAMSDKHTFHNDMDESNVLKNPESYEIEIELDNARIFAEIMARTRSGAVHDATIHIDQLRTCILYILQGLQKCRFPIPYRKKKEVLDQYFRVMYPGNDALLLASSSSSSNDDQQQQQHPQNGNASGGESILLGRKKRATMLKKYFAGPSSVSLQHEHFSIRQPYHHQHHPANSHPNFAETVYSVTEKADGERRLLFVHEDGGLYMIDSTLDIYFTGTFCTKKEFRNTLLDGEFIDEMAGGGGGGGGECLFLAFDIYAKSGEWKFMLPLVSVIPSDHQKSRFSSSSAILDSTSSSSSSSSVPSASDTITSRLGLLKYVVDAFATTLSRIASIPVLIPNTNTNTNKPHRDQSRRRRYRSMFIAKSSITTLIPWR